MYICDTFSFVFFVVVVDVVIFFGKDRAIQICPKKLIYEKEKMMELAANSDADWLEFFGPGDSLYMSRVYTH